MNTVQYETTKYVLFIKLERQNVIKYDSYCKITQHYINIKHDQS